MLYKQDRDPEKRGISVELINMHTIKPLDVDAILQSVKKTGCVVTAEEHQMAGGLGESAASRLSQHYLAPLEMVAVKDTFGESGTPTSYWKIRPDAKRYHYRSRKVLERK